MKILKSKHQVIWFTGNKDYKVFLNLDCRIKYDLTNINASFPFIMSILTLNKKENDELSELFINQGFKVTDKMVDDSEFYYSNFPELKPEKNNFNYLLNYYINNFQGSFDIILETPAQGLKFMCFLKVLSKKYGWKTNYTKYGESEQTGYSTVIIK